MEGLTISQLADIYSTIDLDANLSFWTRFDSLSDEEHTAFLDELKIRNENNEIQFQNHNRKVWLKKMNEGFDRMENHLTEVEALAFRTYAHKLKQSA